jgi:hypothetical protein
MKKLTLLLSALVLMVGCTKTPETSTPVGREFTVDKLFTFEGCTVYRFGDAGAMRYFTNCSGVTNWTEQCGKNCARNMTIGGGR